MELCAAVTGIFVGWTILALFPRRVVRLSWRLPQDFLVLLACSYILPLLCCEVLAFLLLGYIAFVMYNDLPSPWMAVKEKNVFVTGCDHGLGHALALQLDGLGFRVFAGCLFPDGKGAQTLVEKASGRLMVVPLDVTSKEQVQAAARVVANNLDGRVLHGVVNNAGILMAGNIEVMAADDIRKIMEVNCMGVISVYRAFMPLLRQHRNGTARLVNVASNIGVSPASQMGMYGASKAAVALLTETWRYELKPLGIAVSTIIPSGFKTGILVYDREAAAQKWWNQATEEVQNYFGKACFNPRNRMENYKDYLNADFSKLTTCMVDALLSVHPRPIYYKGLLARTLPFLYCHLPAPLWDRAMKLLGDHYHFPVAALKPDGQGGQSKID